MKTPEEIKKGLGCLAKQKFPNAYCEGCSYLKHPARHLWDCPQPEIITDALAYIQQLEDQFRDLTKLVPKWISVEERLPKNEEPVLIATKWSLMGMRAASGRNPPLCRQADRQARKRRSKYAR